MKGNFGVVDVCVMSDVQKVRKTQFSATKYSEVKVVKDKM